MNSFVDEVKIDISSGSGGDGAVSFRREKYVPKGGPDGGDGGKGGNIVFIVKKNLRTLYNLKLKSILKAENGKPGTGNRKHGKNGKDLEIFVPPGTMIKDPETGEIIYDFQIEAEHWLFLEGGRGGKGNWHFKTSVRQAPRFATEGKRGRQRILLLELNIIADIGFVGLPNAGKSTLLSVLTSARPKIAAYPFTTKIPNLGIMYHHFHDIIIADIPGIIKGASQGTGLGIKFLKHIARTRLLVYLLDVSQPDYLEALKTLENEVKSYGKGLSDRSRIIIATKLDIVIDLEWKNKLKKDYKEDIILGISSVINTGILELKNTLLEILKQNE